MSKIISIGTAVPIFGAKQNTILDFMHEAYGNETASRKLNLLFNHSGIGSRYSVIPDFDLASGNRALFIRDQEIPKVEERLNVFKENAIPLAIKAIEDAVQKLHTTISDINFTHLITVTCTGLYAPGINAELVEQLDLPNDIFHTSINFLGCNAAFHALKIADMIAQTNKDAKVLVVCVELCTLHFQPKDNNDNLLANTIFGDGAAAVIITSNTNKQFHLSKGMIINGFYSLLLNKGKHLMGWNITPLNFEMILDAKVPEFIGDEINDVVQKAGKQLNIQAKNIGKWAIHPGGKKILDTIRRQLMLTDEDLQYSYQVLDAYGNMSSPTILFVLNEITKTQLDPGESIFAIGFGPGLSIETALLSYEE